LGRGVALRKISRSSIETHDSCPRKAYYLYRYGKGGLDTPSPSEALSIGLALHKGMEILLRTGDVEEAVQAGKGEWVLRFPLPPNPYDTPHWEECGALVEGMVRGWYRARYPDFLEEYEIISIEEEVETLLSPNVVLQSRADAVVRSRMDGTLLVVNWKTMGKKEGTRKWLNDVQMWTEAFAVQNKLGEPVAGCLVEGFYKGPRYAERYATPLLWAYTLLQDDGTLVWDPEYRRPSKVERWTRRPAWKETGFPGGDGLRGWIDWLPLSLLRDQFLQTPPILKNDEVVERWLRTVVRRETDAQHILSTGSQEDIEGHFWQHFGEWTCGWCPFRPICFGQTSPEEMLEAGLLVEREDHHGTSKYLLDVPK